MREYVPLFKDVPLPMVLAHVALAFRERLLGKMA
jgi:hypothetical protein